MRLPDFDAAAVMTSGSRTDVRSPIPEGLPAPRSLHHTPEAVEAHRQRLAAGAVRHGHQEQQLREFARKNNLEEDKVLCGEHNVAMMITMPLPLNKGDTST